jgi:hypothetical protein
MTGLKWTRRTTGKIAEELKGVNIQVSANPVARLLKQLGFSLRVNHKKLSSGSAADRDEQFAYIGELRQRFAARDAPIVSVDTKKRELVGNFKNPGKALNRAPVEVKDHDFRSEADGIAIPYGVYDLRANTASVFVGTSYDTPRFAVDNLAKWWRYDGRRRYPNTTSLLVLADGGGHQRTVYASVETCPPDAALRSLRTQCDGMPLPDRGFQVESDRAQAVQRDQQELGG